MERLYNKFFQLVWYARVAYIGMRLEHTGDFGLEWIKELSELVSNGGKYEVRVTAFRTIARAEEGCPKGFICSASLCNCVCDRRLTCSMISIKLARPLNINIYLYQRIH